MRNKRRVILTAIPILIILILLGLFFYPRSLIFDMVIPLPEYPENIQIYQVVKPEITSEYVANIGAKLGIKGEIKQESDRFLLKDKETGAFLDIRTSTGVISYYNDSDLYPKSGETWQLPPEEEARKIATNFLSERGLLPPGNVVIQIEVVGRANGMPVDLVVNFKSLMIGDPVSGIWSKQSVRIGYGGKVTQANASVARYLPLETVKLKSAKQAYHELKATGKKYVSLDAQWVSINSVSLDYWLERTNDNQVYAYPVYVFKGQSRGLFGGHPGPFIGRIDATEASSIDFPGLSRILSGQFLPIYQNPPSNLVNLNFSD